ncbi:MAG: site-specific integrase [Armatimonadetes bacterium]|nr:MAG: site-specific integrase [Armatimonadota bacterium]
MGAVSRVTHRSGRRAWQTRWRDPAGRQRSKNFDRKIDAERYLLAMETDKLRGRYTDPRLAKTALGEWMSEYQATRVNLGRQTQARDEATIRNHVLPRFGTWMIGSIQPIHVAQWVADLDAAGYAPATVRKAYQLLSAAMDAAVESGLIGRSPCRGVDLPRLETRSTIRFLEPAEINFLADAIDSRYSAMVLTAAYTGLRFSELRALRVDGLDALRRAIRVKASLVESGGKFYFENPKSEASRRTLRVPSFLVEVLAIHLGKYADDSGLIFSAPDGGPIRRSNFRRRIWLPAVEASVGQPCTFHDLRHTQAALLIAQGEHPKVIQERLGHASIKTTLDTYGHLFEGLDEAATDRLESTYAAADVHAMCTRDDSEVIALKAK